MDIRQYIESGIIELYVMNALSANEMAEVEALARQHTEIQAEIDSVQSIMQSYSQAHALTPNPQLKNKILNKIQAEAQGEIETLKQTTSKTPLSIFTVLAGLTALVLGITTFYYYQQYQVFKLGKEKCEEDKNVQLLKTHNQIADLGQKLNILKSADTKIIPLNGLPISKDSKATVYWNAKEKATLLTIQNLPTPAPDKQYQLWALVKGKPVDGGVFDYSLTDIQTMKIFENAEGFAITLEPQGGRTEPTLEKMYVLGIL